MLLEDNPERRPQTFGGAVYLLVLVNTVAGLSIVVLGSWRIGVILIGTGLLVGGTVRLVLPERRAGMLRVRRKASDVLMLVASGVVLIVLAIVVPEQPR